MLIRRVVSAAEKNLKNEMIVAVVCDCTQCVCCISLWVWLLVVVVCSTTSIQYQLLRPTPPPSDNS